MNQHEDGALLILIVIVAWALGLLLLILVGGAVTASAEIHDGAIGRIEIPSIRADFDLSYHGADVNAHQHIALLYKAQGCQRVGNHYASSATWKLENVSIGDKAYLEYVTGNGCEVIHHREKYVCYAILIADVDGNTLSRNGQELTFAKTDLVCVTCVWSDTKHNYVACFERCE